MVLFEDEVVGRVVLEAAEQWITAALCSTAARVGSVEDTADEDEAEVVAEDEGTGTELNRRAKDQPTGTNRTLPPRKYHPTQAAVAALVIA